MDRKDQKYIVIVLVINYSFIVSVCIFYLFLYHSAIDSIQLSTAKSILKIRTKKNTLK